MKIVKNKDEEIVKYIQEKLEENEGYCPCALLKEPENKCMCQDFKDKIEAGYIGECNCGLYKSEPSVIYLCGDRRYKKDFLYWHEKFSKDGIITIMLPFNSDEMLTKTLKNLHYQMMTVADCIFVIDKFGSVTEELDKDLKKFKGIKRILYASETED